MTTTHSAGPWRYDYEPGYCGELIAADGTTICTFSDEPKTKDAMVMSAAPELLEALESCVIWNGKRGPDDNLLPIDRQPGEIAKAMRAIAKARGET